jgi:hypothetical protein
VLHRLLAVLLAAIGLLLVEPEAQAGPWAIGQGRLFVDLRFTATTASELADQDGRHLPMRIVADAADLGKEIGQVRTNRTHMTDLNGELYVEYGLLSRLTLAMNWQFARSISLANPGGDIDWHSAHVGDLELAGRITLFDDVLAVALHLGVVFPTGATNTRIPIGQGDVRTDFRVLVGKIVERWRFYIAGELGVRLRGSAKVRDDLLPAGQKTVDYSDEITYALEFGYFWKIQRRAMRQILLGGKLQGKYATGESIPDPFPNIVPAASAFLKIGPEITFYLTERWLFHVGVRTVPVARSVPFLTDYVAGVAFYY